MQDLLLPKRLYKASELSGVTITAIPDGRKWRLKALSQGDATKLPNVFVSRLEALGAGVLLAEQCGGKVCP